MPEKGVIAEYQATLNDLICMCRNALENEARHNSPFVIQEMQISCGINLSEMLYQSLEVRSCIKRLTMFFSGRERVEINSLHFCITRLTTG